MEQQLKRKDNEKEYSVRFEEAKSEVERISHILARVKGVDMEKLTEELHKYHILNNDLIRLREMKEFIINVFELQQCSAIYIFFQR